MPGLASGGPRCVDPAMKGWTLDDIPWHAFDPDKVDADLLAAVKAAALVESNGRDYETYLHKVFPADPKFGEAATAWALEEVRHGEALGRWAGMAHPSFDYETSLGRFRDGYQLPLDVAKSVRGTRSGELIARCVVEAGTSSFYSALSNAAEEPVLKEICRLIAADEFRHYKLFYDTLGAYLENERIGRWRRVWVALGRIFESEDDELAFAYFCANDLPGPYNRRDCSRAYARRVYGVYREGHLSRAVGMVLRAAGLRPRGRLGLALSRVAWRFVRWRGARLAAAQI